LVLTLGVLAMSTGAIFARLAQAPSVAIAFWRCALAAVVLAPLAAPRLGQEVRGLARSELLLLLASGCLLALHFASWIRSLEYTSVASSVLLVNTGPLWVGLLTPLLTRDRLGRGLWVGILASVVGSAIVAGGDLELGGQALFGDALALLGALGSSLYLIAGRRLRRQLSFPVYAVLCYGTAACALLLTGFVSGTPLTGFSAATWGWLAACGLIPQVLGHTAANWALRWASASLVAVALLGEPIASAGLAALTLAESPGATFYLGAPLILLGIYWAARSEARNASRKRES
jgi:drug/metabolite transporter (DMT)-like permease